MPASLNENVWTPDIELGQPRLLENHFADLDYPDPVSTTVDVFLGRPVMLLSGSIFTLVGVLSGTDEAVGRAMVATLAWGSACEALGHADEFAEMHPSELSVARTNAARADVIRTREIFNEALAAVGLDPFVADELVGGR